MKKGREGYSMRGRTVGRGTGEMAQQVRGLTALPKVMSSKPSNHMVAHNHPYEV